MSRSDSVGSLAGPLFCGRARLSTCAAILIAGAVGAEPHALQGTVAAPSLNHHTSIFDPKGALYGTTSYGGSLCSGGGCGTVFQVTP